MKSFLTFMVVHFSLIVGYAQVKTEKLSHNENTYYNITGEGHTKLLIFLHGGVRNPIFKENKNIPLDYLLEDNSEWINTALVNGFDIIAPVTNGSLNWLERPEFCFDAFKNYIDHLDKGYEEVWISGFSDGGTGSFKVFYNQADFFEGLIVFNGYPHHKNYAEELDYCKVNNKKIVFFGTEDDKQIQYEFLLTEYAKQKAYNPNTFFYLTEGGHSFKAYQKKDFELLFRMLFEINNKETIPLHGLVIDDQLIELYEFRKSIVRKYGFGEAYYLENKRQRSQN